MAAPPLFVARAVEGGFAPEPGAASDVLALAGGEAVAVVAGPTPDGWCSGYRLAAPGAVGWVSAHYLVEAAAAEPGGGGGEADADATESDDDSDDGADDEATVLRGAEQSAALVREFHRVDWGEPQPAAAARYPTLSCTLLRSEAGFGLTLDGQLRVTGVVAGAGAELAGVAPGMQLVELQGRPLDTEAGRRDAKLRLKTEARVQAVFRCELSPRARPPRTEPAAPAPDLQNDTETDSDGDDDSFATAPGEAAASQPAPRPAPAPSPVGGSRRPGAVSRSPRVPGATRGLGSRRPATTAAVGTPAPLAPRSAAAPEAGAVGAISQPAGVARRPSALRQPAASLPAGWRMEASKSTGLNYYYNTLTGQSTFELPSEPAAAQGEAAAPTESAPAAAEGADDDDDDAIPEISLAHKTRRALIALADAQETEAPPSEGLPPTGAVQTEALEQERASDVLAADADADADADAAPAAPSQSAVGGGTRRRRGGGLFCCGAPQGGGREEETPRDPQPCDSELPPGWKTAVSRSSGELYWISDHGESTYHKPVMPPPGWTVQISRSSGDLYYYHAETGESSYDVPE